MNGYRVTCAAALVTAALTCAAALPAFAEGSADEDGISLQRGTQWMSVQAGYAQGAGDIAPDGLIGGAFGYRRFVLDRWSVGGFVGCDLLGKFGGAADIDVPLIDRDRAPLEVGLGGLSLLRVRRGRPLPQVLPDRRGRQRVHPRTARHRRGDDAGPQGRAARPLRAHDLGGEAGRQPGLPGADPDRRKLDDFLEDLKGTSGPTMPLMYSNTESKTRLLWGVKLDYTLSY